MVVEALGSILTGADPDLVRPIMKYAEKAFKEVRTNVKVLKMATSGKQIKVSMECNGEKTDELYDRVLVSVGRTPNTTDLGLENTKVQRDEKGYINVDHEQRTADPNLFAIGDVAGGVLLAHKAAKEAHVAVEVISGEKSAFENIIIPAVVFTDPELAWCGLTEAEAKAGGKRSACCQVSLVGFRPRDELRQDRRHDQAGVDPETERILGVGIVGAGAGELISEAVMAIEMGATAQDVAQSVHPHPTLSETIFEAAEMYYGYATHMYSKKKS